MTAWWHRWVLRHSRRVSRCTVPMWDPWANGTLITCECGKRWAR